LLSIEPVRLIPDSKLMEGNKVFTLLEFRLFCSSNFAISSVLLLLKAKEIISSLLKEVAIKLLITVIKSNRKITIFLFIKSITSLYDEKITS